MLGFGPIGSTPIGGLPDDFSAEFDIERPIDGKPFIETVSFFDQVLIRELYYQPDRLKVINRRAFEQLVAELFSGFGYEVEMTQQTHDGGKDIIAVKRQEVNVRYLIECKRPDPSNPVAVSAVRELYAVKVSEGATKAILATTTYFTPEAQLFSEKHLWELELKDFEAIKEWIGRYQMIKGL